MAMDMDAAEASQAAATTAAGRAAAVDLATQKAQRMAALRQRSG